MIDRNISLIPLRLIECNLLLKLFDVLTNYGSWLPLG